MTSRVSPSSGPDPTPCPFSSKSLPGSGLIPRSPIELLVRFPRGRDAVKPGVLAASVNENKPDSLFRVSLSLRPRTGLSCAKASRCGVVGFLPRASSLRLEALSDIYEDRVRRNRKLFCNELAVERSASMTPGLVTTFGPPFCTRPSFSSAGFRSILTSEGSDVDGGLCEDSRLPTSGENTVLTCCWTSRALAVAKDRSAFLIEGRLKTFRGTVLPIPSE